MRIYLALIANKYVPPIYKNLFCQTSKKVWLILLEGVYYNYLTRMHQEWVSKHE